MKDNQKGFLPLNIQLFAEEGNESVDTTAEKVEEADNTATDVTAEKKERMFSRGEVNRMINAEKEKLRAELRQEAETQKTEAEKLAKLDTEQKLKYQLDKEIERADGLQSQLNFLTLKGEATSYANEKGLPAGYIEDLDFAKETAESIKTKIDKLVDLRSKDLAGYLNDKLKQSSPKAVESKKETVDPYIQGFKNYRKK